MTKNKITLLGLLGFALGIIALAAIAEDIAGRVVRYRVGSVLSFDGTVTLMDEDGAWTFKSGKLSALATTNAPSAGKTIFYDGTNTYWGSGSGSGDVVAAGQNNFSGSNYLSGNVTFASSSSVKVQGTQSIATLVVTNPPVIDLSLATNANGTEIRSGTVAAARIADLSATYVARNGGIGTNLTFYGSSGGTNYTFTDSAGWHNTNTVAANAGVTIAKGRILAQATDYYTNLNNTTPDFSVGASLLSTNNNFTFLAPVNIDAGNSSLQTIVVFVTNTTSVAKTITAPANCHGSGTLYVTNLTRCTFEVWGGTAFTNLYAVPIF